MYKTHKMLRNKIAMEMDYKQKTINHFESNRRNNYRQMYKPVNKMNTMELVSKEQDIMDSLNHLNHNLDKNKEFRIQKSKQFQRNKRSIFNKESQNQSIPENKPWKEFKKQIPLKKPRFDMKKAMDQRKNLKSKN